MTAFEHARAGVAAPDTRLSLIAASVVIGALSLLVWALLIGIALVIRSFF